MFNYVVKSILPRVHWSAEELAEGAFLVGEGNTTMPRHQPASNFTKLVVEGVNKTMATVIGVLGDVTRDVVDQVLHPGPQNNLPTSSVGGGKKGGVPDVPRSGTNPEIPPSTPSEVMSILKVVFVLFTTLIRDKAKFPSKRQFLLKDNNEKKGQGQLLLRFPFRLRPLRPLPWLGSVSS